MLKKVEKPFINSIYKDFTSNKCKVFFEQLAKIPFIFVEISGIKFRFSLDFFVKVEKNQGGGMQRLRSYNKALQPVVVFQQFTWDWGKTLFQQNLGGVLCFIFMKIR